MLKRFYCLISLLLNNMVLELYAFGPSPPCRCVKMVLKALQLDFEVKSVDLITKEHKTDGFAQLNPRQKVPCLRDGDYVISESRAIAAYLCNKFSGDHLYPSQPEKRGTVDQLLYVSENVVDMIQEYVNFVGVVFFGGKIKKENVAVAKRALGFIEGYLTDREFTAADHVTIADFFLSSPMSMLEIAGFDIAPEFPKTAAWLDKIKALPYFDECNKKGLETMTKMYETKGQCFNNDQKVKKDD
uniref:Glutathione S-transferase 1-1-like n=1 Tax=Phallusia mammillata TaxID=59560 RepID=A0A6F9DEN4_9ASCI|nr:glutathione S-transferase 1-1-like [Phallusia mammillata]